MSFLVIEEGLAKSQYGFVIKAYISAYKYLFNWGKYFRNKLFHFQKQVVLISL